MRGMFASAVCRDAAILVSVIVLYLAAAAAISHATAPFPGDPDYIYLFGGLDIISLRAPAFYDHPGTPVQTAIALITIVTWLATLPLHGFGSKLNDILLHSQFYLACICAVFALAVASAMAFFAWNIRTASGSLAPALIGLFVLATSDSFYSSFRHVDPEPILLAATLMLAGLLARIAFDPPDRPQPTGIAIGIGVLLALCVTAKITSGPTMLAILALRTGRAKAIAAATFSIAALFFLAPIFPHLVQMMAKDWHILTHRGDYGSGAAGAPSVGELWQNAIRLWNSLPELFWAPLLFCALPLIARQRNRPLPYNFERIFLVCAAIILSGILLVAKQPRPYYLIPTLAFLGLGIAMAAVLLLRRIRLRSWVTAGFIGLLGVEAFHAQVVRARAEATEWKDEEALLARTTRSGCLLVPYYAVDLPQWDLYFGNDMTGDRFGGRLAKLYPDFVTYHIFRKQFSTFALLLTPEAAAKRFAREKCVQLIGIPWQDSFGLPTSALVRVDGSQLHAVYRLKDDWAR